MKISYYLRILWFLLLAINELSGQNAPILTIPTLDKYYISGVKYSAAMNYYITYGSDNNIKIWRGSDYKLLKSVSVGEYGNPVSLDVSPDGMFVAFTDNYKFSILNLNDFSIRKSGELEERFGVSGGAYTNILFTKDGQTLYIGGGDYQSVHFWKASVKDLKAVYLSTTEMGFQDLDPADGSGGEAVKGLTDMSFSTDGKFIVGTSGAKDLVILDTKTGKAKVVKSLPGTAHALTQNASLVSCASLEGQAGQEIRVSKFPENTIQWKGAIDFRVIKVISSKQSNKCYLLGSAQYAILDVDAKSISKPFKINTEGARDMVLDSKEQHFAYVGSDDEKSIFAIRDINKQTDTRIGESVFSVSKITVSSKDNWYMIQKNGGQAKAIVIKDGSFSIKTIPFEEEGKFAALSPNQSLGAASNYDNKITLFDLKSPNLNLQSIEVPSNLTQGLVFSKDGNLMAALTIKGALIYDSKSRQLKATLLSNGDSEYNNEMFYGAFSNDGKKFVATYGGLNARWGVMCWEIASGKILWEQKKVEYSLFSFNENDSEISCVNVAYQERAAVVLDAATGMAKKYKKLDLSYPKSDELNATSDFKYVFDKSNTTRVQTENGEQKSIPKLNGYVEDARMILKGKFALVSHNETDADETLINKFALIDIEKGTILATLYFYDDSEEWAIITPDGRYDASPGAMEKMYYVQGNNIIPLEALSEKFYIPKLLNQLLNGNAPAPEQDIKNLKLPPKVSISYEQQQRNLGVENDIPTYKSETETVTINVKAESKDDVVTEIRLFHNDKLVGTTRNLVVADDNTGEKMMSKQFSVTLQNGDNTFKAIALNSQRTESEPDEIIVNFKPAASSQTQQARGIQLHLVVVGINTYKNPKYNLNYAEADAKAFEEAMTKGSSTLFSKVNTSFISNQQATKIGIAGILDGVKEKATANDVFVFYYAGHGVINESKEFYLVPHDVTQLYGSDDALAQKGFSANEMQKYSQEIKAQKQLFILDACQSAGALDQVVAARGAAEEKAIAQLARSTGTYWLTASGSEQFASEFTQLGHGAFTYCLLEALSGKADSGDKKITVKEIDAYLQDTVPTTTQKYKGTPQYPASYGKGNDFPILLVK